MNTIKPKCVDLFVYNAIKKRDRKETIENKIEVIPFFRDIFTSELSLIGNKGNTIRGLRKDHKTKQKKYRGRRKYNLNYI